MRKFLFALFSLASFAVSAETIVIASRTVSKEVREFQMINYRVEAFDLKGRRRLVLSHDHNQVSPHTPAAHVYTLEVREADRQTVRLQSLTREQYEALLLDFKNLPEQTIFVKWTNSKCLAVIELNDYGTFVSSQQVCK